VERQLNIYGHEVPLSAVGNHRALSEAQRDIMRTLAFQGGVIRPVEAGAVLHAHRDDAPIKPEHFSSDGAAALKRLEARGLVAKQSRGRWCSTS